MTPRRLVAVVAGIAVAVAVWLVAHGRGHPADHRTARAAAPVALPVAPIHPGTAAPAAGSPPGPAPAAPAPALPAPAPADTAGVSSSPIVPGPKPPPLAPAPAPPGPKPSPYPAGLSPAEERAMRVRDLVELRALVSDADRRIRAGDDAGGKLEALRTQSAARMAELQRWADQHGVTTGELDRAAADHAAQPVDHTAADRRARETGAAPR
jgi:hypothetical protein